MGMSNAERQARHRARIREKLAGGISAGPLRNELLETMMFAYLVAHRSAVEAALEGIDARQTSDDEDWEYFKRAILESRDKIESLSAEFFTGLAAASGERMGNYLVMGMRREYLASKIEKRAEPKDSPRPKKARRKTGVT